MGRAGYGRRPRAGRFRNLAGRVRVGASRAASGRRAGGPGRLLEAMADASGGLHESESGAVFDICAAADDSGGAGPGGLNAGGSRRRPVLGRDLVSRICEAASSGAGAVEEVRALGLTVVTLEEPSYPDRLRRVELPPPLLFVRGSVAALQTRDAVAVVGTRRPTDKGRLIAGWIGSAVARTGAAV